MTTVLRGLTPVTRDRTMVIPYLLSLLGIQVFQAPLRPVPALAQPNPCASVRKTCMENIKGALAPFPMSTRIRKKGLVQGSPFTQTIARGANK